MLNWTKTIHSNYITSFEHENTHYNIQVYSNGVYKIVEIAYKINILGRKEPYNKVLFEGFSSNVFSAMSLAETTLRKLLNIEEIVNTPNIIEPEQTPIEEERVITEEEEIKIKNLNPELYQEIKEDIQEQRTPVCTKPVISLVDTDVGTYISITGDSEDQIRFTTNGKNVSISSKLYRRPFLLKPGMTVKIKAFNENKKNSEQVKYVTPTES